VEQSFTRKCGNSEETSGKSSTDLSKEEANEIFGAGGLLTADAAPRLHGLSQDANMALLAAVEARTTGGKLTKDQAALDKKKAEADKKKTSWAMIKSLISFEALDFSKSLVILMGKSNMAFYAVSIQKGP
jgi:hypothetical protein